MLFPSAVAPMRLNNFRLRAPPGEINTASKSPAHWWLRVRLTATCATVPVSPDTLKLMTKGSPGAGVLVPVPSGMAPVPVPGKTCAIRPAAGSHASSSPARVARFPRFV